ncbi:MAG: peptidoglycan bridge formation glycyltransferase FemA/FemB family protein [Patescibacteria group bacterium]
MRVFLDSKNQDQWLEKSGASGAFLQSSLWQKFLDRQGKKNWTLNLESKSRIIGRCLLYETKLGLGKSYLYAPKGPIWANDLAADEILIGTKLLLSSVRDITIETRQYQEIFFRLEPQAKIELENTWRAIDIQPRETWCTNLDLDNEALLRQSHPKTRYNIALAKRKGVRIVFSQTEKDLEVFLSLLKKTAKRNHIGLHSGEYYHQLWSVLLADNSGELALAYAGNQVVAANFLIKFGQTATYLHGASDYQNRSLMAPQLLHWESIKRYRDQGYKTYDWWGIAPEDGSKPGWQGVTRFKQGFSGRRVYSAGTYDFVYDHSWYKFYAYLRKARRFFR